MCSATAQRYRSLAASCALSDDSVYCSMFASFWPLPFLRLYQRVSPCRTGARSTPGLGFDFAPSLCRRRVVGYRGGVCGAAVPLMYRACLVLIGRRHRDGLAVSPLCARPARCSTGRACRRRDVKCPHPRRVTLQRPGQGLDRHSRGVRTTGVSRRSVQRLAAPSHARPCVRAEGSQPAPTSSTRG